MQYFDTEHARVLGFVSQYYQYYVSRHQFIFSPTWAFKLVPEVHALCYGRYMLCRSLKALGFPDGKPLPRSFSDVLDQPPPKAAMTSPTCPGCCRYGWRCCSTVSEAARSTRGGGFFDGKPRSSKCEDPSCPHLESMGIWDFVGFQTWST